MQAVGVAEEDRQRSSEQDAKQPEREQDNCATDDAACSTAGSTAAPSRYFFIE